MLYCKACKGSVHLIKCWYLFDNINFYNRIAFLGQCKKCGQDVILLSEQRKSDDKIFNDLQVGNKAGHIIDLIINQINYTLNNTKEKEIPFGWKYGKAIKIKNGYKILRSDFKGNVELIGYIHNNKSNIINENEFNKLVQESKLVNI